MTTPNENYFQTLLEIEKAKENNAELKSMNALVVSSEANVKRVGRQGLPSLSLVGGFNRNYLFSQGSNFNVQYGYVGAQLSIPLFTGFGNLYESQAAEKDYEATLAKKEMLEQKIILEVISSYQECKNSLEMITFTNEFVKTATQSESVARERYKLGVGNLIDLISSQNYLSSAKEKQIEAKYGWLISRSRFLRAIGSLEQNSSSELEVKEG
jgi:outer membrane protein